MRQAITATTLMLLSSLLVAAPVVAAVPANDRYAGRIAIGSLPFGDELDTRDATTDAKDARANEDCGAPATDASVWYTVTAPSDRGLVIDVSSSDFSAGVIVVTGRPRDFSLVTCGPGTVGFETVKGRVYKILVFDDQEDGRGNGGRLEMAVDDIPPPPELDVTIDRFGRFHQRTGSATIRGSVTCIGPANDNAIEINVRQRIGRLVVTGWGWTNEVPCDGGSHRWSAEVVPENGLFKGGKSAAVSWAYACGPFDCGDDYDERIVQLRGGGS